MSAKTGLFMMLLMFAPVQLVAHRAKQNENPDDLLDMDGVYLTMTADDLDNIETVQADAATMFEAGPETSLVKEQSDKYEGSEITHIVEVRTKLKFKGNRKSLRNPDMVPMLISDIEEQQDKYPESEFLYCLHIGTTAGEEIKYKRKGFMEGRAETFRSALSGSSLGQIEAPFEHYKSTRFAAIVIKVYKGEAPKCEKDDLTPPR